MLLPTFATSRTAAPHASCESLRSLALPNTEITRVQLACDPVLPGCAAALPWGVALELRRFIPRLPIWEAPRGGRNAQEPCCAASFSNGLGCCTTAGITQLFALQSCPQASA